jgi:glycosyltransferase involved in cell wall biosynthesis
MKALQFITRLDLGGAQETCLAQCRMLLERGHEVHLLTAPEGELLPDARRMSGLRLHLWEDWKHRVSPVHDLACLLRLSRMLRDDGFDLLHTHSSKAGIVGRLAAALAGSPRRVVHHVHGWSFNTTQPAWIRSAYVLLERLAARPGFLLLACSGATDAQGRRHRIGRDEDRRIVPYGIDRSENLRARATDHVRRRLGAGARDVVFLQVGNLKPQKDPLTFARGAVLASKRLRRARFWIAGDGPLRPEVERIALEGGIADRFHVLGWRRDVPDLLAAADVLVLTSRFEGLPIAVLRAMAAGLPVVATAVDGTPEAVADGESGLLLRPGDVGALADHLVRLGRDPSRRRAMGHAGRARSAAFTEERAGLETLRAYGIGPVPASH